MISHFFINRPIFAWIFIIVVMLAGTLALVNLPVELYPTIAPPEVTITANYPGADARTIENTVTQVIEQQMNGLDHLAYVSSTSDGAGQATITLSFNQAANPDIAEVQVQNKLQQASPLLPQDVLRNGLTVTKAARRNLLLLAVYSRSGAMKITDLGDLVISRLRDPLGRVNGVGDTIVYDSPYAMRIWLDPFKLNSFGLTPGDVKTAIQAQDSQVAAGQIGGLPHAAGAQLNATIIAHSRLKTAQEFADIILRTNPDGSTVHLRDVARVERGADNYTSDSRYNGLPGSGISLRLAEGANALTTADAVKARVAQLSRTLPPDIAFAYPSDVTPFIRLSIENVALTLLMAVALVFLVMYLFLQDWRATLIPAIAVPVVLFGTFAVLAIVGYSINTLTLFAAVLAIGLLVDDAIVVVENVERTMREEGLAPKEATHKSMGQIARVLIGIATVLSAVFVPMAFFGGSVGVIYRQFSITIVSAMALSVIVALVVTPALCATLLNPVAKGHHYAERGFFGWFNRHFDSGVRHYRSALSRALARPFRLLAVYGTLVVILVFLFGALPTSFFPDEDQGFLYVSYQLAPGATIERTIEVGKQIEHHFLVDEKNNVDGLYTVAGFGFGGQGQNNGTAFVRLKDWSLRKGAYNRVDAIARRATAALSNIPNASVYAFVPPPVSGLGNASGFDLELEDQAGLGHPALIAARNKLIDLARKDPKLATVRPNGEDDTPRLELDIDRTRAGALGLSLADVNDVLSTAWSGSYVDDYIENGRVKHVFVQGDAPFRSRPEDLDRWYARSASGAMVPFSAFASSHWTSGPPVLTRYNGVSAEEILGTAAPGISSGTAMREMERLAAELPAGIGYEWTGLSRQEELSGAKTPTLYGLSLLVVFLCLAALYESWSVPLSVILVVPLGIFGAVVAVTLRDLANDVYFQVGLLTTTGLSAKNAILIVEFAERGMRQGMSALEAALDAARVRLRPILMTSLSFAAGVTPLALATGAGAGSQIDIGTGVVGGVVAGTVLAVVFVPLFFVLVMKLFPAAHANALPEEAPVLLPVSYGGHTSQSVIPGEPRIARRGKRTQELEQPL